MSNPKRVRTKSNTDNQSIKNVVHEIPKSDLYTPPVSAIRSEGETYDIYEICKDRKLERYEKMPAELRAIEKYGLSLFKHGDWRKLVSDEFTIENKVTTEKPGIHNLIGKNEHVVTSEDITEAQRQEVLEISSESEEDEDAYNLKTPTIVKWEKETVAYTDNHSKFRSGNQTRWCNTKELELSLGYLPGRKATEKKWKKEVIKALMDVRHYKKEQITIGNKTKYIVQYYLPGYDLFIAFYFLENKSKWTLVNYFFLDRK